ncbi:hypothetical protein BBJ29_003702 [Phytophthora kernoviae]|uniref:Uncharacterized protein n=1 Tax=Phytophthora kernoviae TaxID=325452 RepID=A0A3F2S358_9STRA|nr:hypothetical protein BBJ29_003702 [Phytophthora kernoviae]RLN69208.1 hypothetical protein BBP00_00000451 [Phytophthora kernoviae]
MGGETVVGTRLHWHSHSQRERIDVEKLLRQVSAFCTRAALCTNSGILIAVGLPTGAVGAMSGVWSSLDEDSSSSSVFIQSVREFIIQLQTEVAAGSIAGKVEIIPMVYWGKFVPALNALVSVAADRFPEADTLLLQSLEVEVDKHFQATNFSQIRACNH